MKSEDKFDHNLKNSLVIEPFLHLFQKRMYNPINDRNIFPMDLGYKELRQALLKKRGINSIAEPILQLLIKEGWIIRENNNLSKRFYLKYVSLEAHTVCNQACYFCPVSINPREDYYMPTELYENILSQLSEFKDTIEAIYMINYNEPTVDKRFIEQIQAIKYHGLPPAVNTNATGLTPARVDAIMEMGGLQSLSVNLSTMDKDRYTNERAQDHITIVMRNMDYIKDKQIAEIMDLAVLGKGDELHKKDYEEISEYFSNSYFNVKYYEIMDRAGYLTVGNKPPKAHDNLCGCDNLGSRPLQHIHITPQGKCVLCCEDYDETNVVGDLTKQTVQEVLEGPEIEKIRKWTYGLEKAPDNFICKKCVFAIPERKSIREPSILGHIMRSVVNLKRLGI